MKELYGEKVSESMDSCRGKEYWTPTSYNHSPDYSSVEAELFDCFESIENYIDGTDDSILGINHFTTQPEELE